MLNEREQRLGVLFDEAMQLRDAGELAAARRLLLSLVAQLGPEDKTLFPHAHIQLGQIANRLGDQVQREAHFRAAVEASPNQELASLGLFRTMFHLGRYVEAFQEMVRLLERRYSEMYDELLTPTYGRELRGELRQLLRQARELLAQRLAAKLRRN